MLDADNSWTRRGTLNVLLRCLAETKFAVVYSFALLDQVVVARRQHNKGLCANPSCVVVLANEHACMEEMQCMLAHEKDKLLPFLPVEKSDIIFLQLIAVLTAINVCVVVFSVLDASNDDRRWRQTDIALCYQLNRYYARHRWVFYVKALMVAIYLGTLITACVYAYRDGSSNLFSSQVIPGVVAIVALTSLHKPNPDVLKIAYSVYKEKLEGVEFAYVDLMSSAPTLLTAKLTAAALSDCHDESEEHGMAA